MIDEQRLLAIVREAATIAYNLWPDAERRADGRAGPDLKSWEKEPGSPVCDADIAVDTFLRRELGALLPSAGWLSEETADDPVRLDNDLIWLVDPVDGTRDFIRGRPGWAVSVALISNGRPLIGILAAPARKEEWLAVAGKGAFRNGERLVASSRAGFDGSRIPADVLPKEDRGLVTVEKPNSIALRIAMVAADEADLIATLRWGFEWDIGAAALIAMEAGARATDVFGKKLAYNKRDPRAFGLLVCAPDIHATAVERLAERAKRLV